MKTTEAPIKRNIILVLFTIVASATNSILAEPGFETYFCIFFGSVALLTLIVLTCTYYALKDLRISGRLRDLIEKNNANINLLFFLDFYVIGFIIMLSFSEFLKELNVAVIIIASVIIVYLNIIFFLRRMRQKQNLVDGDINEFLEQKELSRRG